MSEQDIEIAEKLRRIVKSKEGTARYENYRAAERLFWNEVLLERGAEKNQ